MENTLVELEMDENDTLFNEYIKNVCNLEELELEFAYTCEDLKINPDNMDLQIHSVLLYIAIQDLADEINLQKNQLDTEEYL